MTDPAFTDPLGAVEVAIEERLKEVFGWNAGARLLKQIQSTEFPFDKGTDEVTQVAPPGAYIVPLVARPGQFPDDYDQQWAVYAVASRPTSTARGRGGTGAYGIGAYEIAYRIAAALHDFKPPVETADCLKVLGIENLSGLTLTKKSMSVFAVTLSGTIKACFEPIVQDGKLTELYIGFAPEVGIEHEDDYLLVEGEEAAAARAALADGGP